MKTLDLTRANLIEIANRFAIKTVEGLEIDAAELQCIPTFIPVKRTVPEGRAYVLDLGGSNARAGLVSIHQGRAEVIRRSETIKMPWKRNEPFAKDKFFRILTDLLNSISVEEPLPLGYCFSYPTTSLSSGDAVLRKWTKDIVVPGTESMIVGESLLAYAVRRNDFLPKISSVTVLNDTIACLLSGTDEIDDSTIRIGMIVGTGFNIASFFPSETIRKLKGRVSPGTVLPVNLEAGGFICPHQTRWDHLADIAGGGGDVVIVEKMLSGAYLGRLLKAVYPECPLDPERGAINLVEIMNDKSGTYERFQVGAKALYQRSAKLVSACLAGLIGAISDSDKLSSRIIIQAEGSLFWSKVGTEYQFHDTVLETLSGLVAELRLGNPQVQFQQVASANFFGSANAALIQSPL